MQNDGRPVRLKTTTKINQQPKNNYEESTGELRKLNARTTLSKKLYFEDCDQPTSRSHFSLSIKVH